MNEITIEGQDYLIGKLSARQQFYIAKRLAPVIQGLLPIWAAVQRNKEGEISNEEVAVQAVVAISNTINLLSDSDADYVLDLCLGVVKFKSGGSWAPLRAGNGSGQVMFEAADTLVMQMRLLFEVLRANLANFTLTTLLPTSLQLELSPTSPLSS